MTKGFWLEIELLHDKNTTMQEKLLLIEISNLSMLDKGCIASNTHFAELFQVKKESISRSLSSLEKKGYISTEIKKGSRNHNRTITINKLLFDPKQNVIAPLTNCLESKENKTINKTINNIDVPNNINKSSFDEWIAHKKYKTKAPITKCINFLSEFDFITQKEIIDTSIMNGWKGLFKPKQTFENKQQNRAKAINDAFGILKGNRIEGIDYEC